jgi:acyl carrier protein
VCGPPQGVATAKKLASKLLLPFSRLGADARGGLKIVSIEHEVRRFIENNLLFRESTSFSDEDSFIEEGIIDSTGVLELVHFLEDQYGLKVEDDEIIPENLDSISRLGKYVRAKYEAGVSETEAGLCIM